MLQLKKDVANVIGKRTQRASRSNDPLEEKQKAMDDAIRKGNREARAPKRFKKDKYKLGKTGDSNTGEVTEAHKKTAALQIEVAQRFRGKGK